MIDDTIRAKLDKLVNMAERGEAGEAQKAKILLEKKLGELGLTIDDLLDKREVKLSMPRNKAERIVFIHLIAVILNATKIHYTQSKGSGFIYLNVTMAEEIDLKSMLPFYMKQFRKTLRKNEELLAKSFIQANNLYPDSSEEAPARSYTPEEIREAMTIASLAETLEPVQYHKQLNK